MPLCPRQSEAAKGLVSAGGAPCSVQKYRCNSDGSTRRRCASRISPRFREVGV